MECGANIQKIASKTRVSKRKCIKYKELDARLKKQNWGHVHPTHPQRFPIWEGITYLTKTFTETLFWLFCKLMT